MIGGKDWLSLVAVSAVALAFITLMIVIQALQHERTRGEILRGVAVVWGAVALTLLVAWLLEDYWGGAVIDVQVSPSPEIVTRPLTSGQIAALGAMVVALLALYVAAIMSVRKLTQPSEELTVHHTGDRPAGSRDESE
ncbi:MAG: hypothetical protein ACLFU7_00220 [Armatimonadota bacterium]